MTKTGMPKISSDERKMQIRGLIQTSLLLGIEPEGARTPNRQRTGFIIGPTMQMKFPEESGERMVD
jgi:hypothetical protein